MYSAKMVCNSLYQPRLQIELPSTAHFSWRWCLHAGGKPAIGHTPVEVLYWLICLHVPLIAQPEYPCYREKSS